jgi:hypothetical protein
MRWLTGSLIGSGVYATCVVPFRALVSVEAKLWLAALGVVAMITGSFLLWRSVKNGRL